MWPAGPARASTSSAQSAYDKGDYATAAQEYAAAAQRDPKKPLLQFNAGAAAYRAGQFPQAAQAFQASINHAVSGDPRHLAEQQDAYYNLGNTLYRTGQKTAQSAPQQTLDTWAKAVKAYDTALELRADDADSKFNRDFVKRKINELKQQQNQNPQQNPQNKNQQNNQNNQQNQNQPPQAGQPPPGQQPPARAAAAGPATPRPTTAAERRPATAGSATSGAAPSWSATAARPATSRPATPGTATATERRPAAARSTQARAR